MAAKKKTSKKVGKKKAKTKRKNKTLAATADRKVEIFCQAIDSGLTQAEAYRKAFPRSLNWKIDSVYSEASKFAHTPKVMKRMSQLKEESRLRHNNQMDAIITGLRRITDFDPRKLFDEKGKLLPVELWPDDIALAIEAIESPGTDNMKLKVHSKLSAFRMLGQRLKMWNGENGMSPAGMSIQSDMPAPQLNVNINLNDVDPKEASRLYQQIINGE